MSQAVQFSGAMSSPSAQQQLLSLLLSSFQQQQPQQMATPQQPRERMLVAVQLANESNSEDASTSSQRVVKTSISKEATKSGDKNVSVGEWTRDTVCENAEWLLKICKRNKEIRETSKGAVRLIFGNGFDALVSFNGADFPVEMARTPRIGVVLCVASNGNSDDAGLSNGESTPGDNVWDHMQSCLEVLQQPRAALAGANDHHQTLRIYLHTQTNGGTHFPSNEHARVLRVFTLPGDASVLENLEQRADLEDELAETGRIGEIGPRKKKKKPADGKAAKSDTKNVSFDESSKKSAPSEPAVAAKDVFAGDEVATLKKTFDDESNKKPAAASAAAQSELPGFTAREVYVLGKFFKQTWKDKDRKEMETKTDKDVLRYARRLITEKDKDPVKAKEEANRKRRATAEAKKAAAAEASKEIPKPGSAEEPAAAAASKESLPEQESAKKPAAKESSPEQDGASKKLHKRVVSKKTQAATKKSSTGAEFVVDLERASDDEDRRQKKKREREESESSKPQAKESSSEEEEKDSSEEKEEDSSEEEESDDSSDDERETKKSKK